MQKQIHPSNALRFDECGKSDPTRSCQGMDDLDLTFSDYMNFDLLTWLSPLLVMGFLLMEEAKLFTGTTGCGDGKMNDKINVFTYLQNLNSEPLLQYKYMPFFLAELGLVGMSAKLLARYASYQHQMAHATWSLGQIISVTDATSPRNKPMK
ncbi:hypothetical protein LTR56_022941 [Elasticomyces elasticus]|nr:hypothetical protein LTR56_022941 [Elasticomyces elasticus]KAK3627044.1 hypothetical protein LTR22_022903 [Elasticomyces elasticus]KAK4907466.1 hypothetical protein LTR49_023490 [Elasticomyces elasticus]KAK5747888.1 hypothetical protein LTS12_022086 [Elasticomyces elasticus]